MVVPLVRCWFVALLVSKTIAYDDKGTYRATKNGQPIEPSARRVTTAKSTPDRKLNQGCTSSTQCAAAFSWCSNGTCKCRRGFSPKGNVCKSSATRCPFGLPNDSLTRCELKVDQPVCNGPQCGTKTLSEPRSQPPEPGHLIGQPILQPQPGNTPTLTWVHNCPNGTFCFIHNAVQNGRALKMYRGHCCLMPKLQCPVGEPAAQYTCNLGLSETAVPNFCPLETHTCLTVALNGLGLPRSARNGVCCPKPCYGSNVFVNSRCYARASPGGNCKVQQQCDDAGAICDRGRCICPKGTITKKERCEEPQCFEGFAENRKLVKPMLRISGSVVTCRKDTHCGNEGYCVQGSYCCSKPAPFCSNNPSANIKHPTLCNPLDRSGQNGGCDETKVCLQYYSPAQGTSSLKTGVCCERAALP
jgi:hypothetical protein